MYNFPSERSSKRQNRNPIIFFLLIVFSRKNIYQKSEYHVLTPPPVSCLPADPFTLHIAVHFHHTASQKPQQQINVTIKTFKEKI